MGSFEHMAAEKLTLLELVLRLHGEFRRSLEPINVTPLQAGLILYLRRHVQGRVTDAAAALRVKPPTLVQVVHDLEHNGWVTKRQSVQDRRAVCLRLSRQGQALARKIEAQIRNVRSDFTPTMEAS